MNKATRTVSTLAGLTLALAGFCSGTPAHAQDAGKKDLATRIVTLQKAHDMDALIAQLAASATQTVVSTWLPRLDDLPPARQKAAADQLDVELKKFNEDNLRTIRSRNDRISLEVLVPAYSEQFTAEEMKQLIAFMESPVIKKFYAANPHMANLLAKRLVEATRTDVEARIKAFDARASRILGGAVGKK